MLSREERIFSELLLARGLVARDFIEGFARKKSSGASEPSLAEFLVDSGGLLKAQADETLEEARAIDQALAPHLAGGARLGDFRLIRELGRGGMGIVYEAEQESLGRRVALKVLPAGAALDERLAIRFLREARAAGRLQHPGIVPVFASGRAEGVLYFAMELVEGRSLADIVAEGPMAPETAARIAAEIARALDHAHQADLVHRDVKPENVLLAADGRARLTDFGLVHESVASSFTLPHHVLGTPAYMAPEQALGHTVDRRSDIYALGAVLYTLLCGKPPYGGDLPSAVLSRVLTGPPPPVRSVKDGIPLGLAAICEKAMARKPEARYAAATELAEELEAFGRGEAPVAVVSPARSRRVGRLVATLTLLIAAIAVAALLIRGRPAAPVAVAPAPNPKFELVNASSGPKYLPSLSPDGKLLAYTARGSESFAAYLQNLETRSVVKMADPGFGIKFSPDGHSVAIGDLQGVNIRALATNTVRHLDIDHFGSDMALDWSADGREIVFGSRNGGTPLADSLGGLRAVDVITGRVRAVRRMNAQVPAFSPHKSRIAFVSLTGGPADVWTTPNEGGDAVRLTNDPATDWSPSWSPDGRRIYFGSERSGTPQLWRAGVDEATGQPIGSPEPALPTVFPGLFFARLSADGKRMAIAGDGEQGRLFRFPLDPATGTLASAPVALHRHAGPAMSPQPSPDGKSIVCTVLSPDEDLAIVADDGSQEPRFLTDDGFVDRAPRWSPDGEYIAFHSNRSGHMEIWTIRPDGSDLRQITRTTNGDAAFPVWSPDGTRLAYSVEGAGAYVIAAGGDSLPELLPAQTAGGSFQSWSWSPDGTTLAGSAGGIVLYSMRDRSYRRITDVGEKPVWLDRHRLAFASDRSIFIVSSDGGAPREIYSAAPSGLLPFLGVSADGRSLYASLTASAEEIWIAELPN